MHKIDAAGAWDHTTGAATIIVADIDTGVDRNHEDLQGQMWVNTVETPGNGVDDDDNGYVDDYHGWDWVNNDPDPMDDHGHGTHTVGTIAGVGNNSKGVVGVNWTSKIMALKFLSSSGSGWIADGAAALQYAADMGAKVSSNSWGGSYSQIADDAIKYEHDVGMVVVVAAGNNNSDALTKSPASADHAVSVAASDYNDAKASFSNWGEKIDVAAPGVGILSLRAPGTDMYGDGTHIVDTKYYWANGTSMACPHVAGLAALLLAKNPSLNNEEIRQIIRGGADDLGDSGKDKNYGYGRINAAGSMVLSGTKPLTPIITSPSSRTTVFGNNLQITGSVPGPNFASYKIEVGEGRAPASWTTVSNSTNQVIDGVLATVDTTRLVEGTNIFRLIATDTSGKNYQFQVHDVDVDNIDAEITSPTSLMTGGAVEIEGTAATKSGLGLSNYKLEWGVGKYASSWSDTGISLASSGNQPVQNGLLGVWDTASLEDGKLYSLRLTVYSTASTSSSYKTTTTFTSSLINGWPIFIDNMPFSTPAIGDINNDGKNEVVITTGYPDDKIYVYDSSANILPGWPYESSGGGFTSSPTLVDLDGDKKLEIIISNITQGFIFNYNGSLKPGWPKYLYTSSGFFRASPAVGDIDADGVLDIIFADNKKVHALHLDGDSLPGFPATRMGLDGLSLSNSKVDSSPVLADINGNGKLEIIIGSRIGKVYIFDSSGQLFSGWPQQTDYYRYLGGSYYDMPTPAVGDLDKNYPGLEIVMPTASDITKGEGWVYVWHKDGTPAPNSPFKVQLSSVPNNQPSLESSPVLYDVDADGNLEIMFSWSQRIFQFNHDGSEFTGSVYFNTRESSPGLYDVNNDGKMDIIFSQTTPSPAKASVWTLPIVAGVTPIWSIDLGYSLDTRASPVIADLDGNGTIDVFTTSGYGHYYAFDLGFPVASGTTFWNQYMGNPQHTGLSLQSSEPPPGKPGDINGDGVVNIFDASILASRWGTSDPDADLNGNGVVDIFDASIMASNWDG